MLKISARWRHQVRAWHYGKLIILWAWGAVVMGLLFYPAIIFDPKDSALLLALGFGALVALVTVPLLLSWLSWTWLGGKQDPAPETFEIRRLDVSDRVSDRADNQRGVTPPGGS